MCPFGFTSDEFGFTSDEFAIAAKAHFWPLTEPFSSQVAPCDGRLR